MESETRADHVEPVGSSVCLDFTNTTSGRMGNALNESLTSYRELVAWGRNAGLLTPEMEERLLAEAQRRPEEAAAVLQRAITLREALYRIFSARAAGRPAEEADLAILNGAVPVAMSRLRLRERGEGFHWEWSAEDELDQMLWPITRSAAELLTAGQLDRVRECGGDSCTWLFLDTTKNRSRRWCDMKDCGNRAKARRHYARTKATKQDDQD